MERNKIKRYESQFPTDSKERERAGLTHIKHQLLSSLQPSSWLWHITDQMGWPPRLKPKTHIHCCGAVNVKCGVECSSVWRVIPAMCGTIACMQTGEVNMQHVKRRLSIDWLDSLHIVVLGPNTLKHHSSPEHLCSDLLSMSWPLCRNHTESKKVKTF